jgi:hypothetical protein
MKKTRHGDCCQKKKKKKKEWENSRDLNIGNKYFITSMRSSNDSPVRKCVKKSTLGRKGILLVSKQCFVAASAMPATDAINQRVSSLCKPDLHPTSSFFPCNFMPSSNSTTSISYDMVLDLFFKVFFT